MQPDLPRLIDILAPHAHANYRAALAQGGPLLAQHGINTPLRLAHFLAQVLHETGGLRILRESMRYSAPRILQIFGQGRHSAAITPEEAAQLARNEEALAERVYGLGNLRKARELGNLRPGDGFRYRGNGILQTTGRKNHARAAAEIGVDFEASPELVTGPAHALKPALHLWTTRGLNAAADRNDLRHSTRKINGGYNGLADRKKWLDKILQLV